MRSEQKALMMSARSGVTVPLKRVSIVARLLDLLAIVEVAQTYRNEGKTGIEAVYTFPLPAEAAQRPAVTTATATCLMKRIKLNLPGTEKPLCPWDFGCQDPDGLTARPPAPRP